MDAQFQVEITDSGRSGGIVYREGDGGEYETWWELAASADVLAFVLVPTPLKWERQVLWAAGRRDEILTRIAAEIVRQKAPGCAFAVGESFIEILRAGR